MKYVAPVDIGKGDTPLQSGVVGDGTPVATHDELCRCLKHDHYGVTDNLRSTCVYCECALIARVRADERDCDAHGDTIRYRCTHYQQGRKDGYAAALRDAVEALGANFEFDELGDQRLAVEIVEALKEER